LGAVAIIGAGMIGPSSMSAQTGQPGTVPSASKHQEGALLALGQNYPNPGQSTPVTRL
jgi:hypothetical protein